MVLRYTDWYQTHKWNLCQESCFVKWNNDREGGMLHLSSEVG